MQLDRLKLRHLRSVVAIAEHRSLVKAAGALFITQPAVSKTLAELEDIVGQRLFDRTPHGVTLTATGRTLLRYAGSSLRTIREGFDSIALSRTVEVSTILLGVLPNVAATVLPTAIQRFELEFPSAQMRVRTGCNKQLIALLRQGELDAVIGRLAEPSEMQGLSFEHLYTEEMQFVVRPGHPLALHKTIRPETLLAYRLVLPDSGTRVREASDQFFMTAGVGLPTRYIETIDVSFGRSFVLQSNAIWCVPFGAIENDVRNGTLVRLRLDTSVTSGPVGLTLRADRLPSAALQRLLDEVRAAAAQRGKRTDSVRSR